MGAASADAAVAAGCDGSVRLSTVDLARLRADGDATWQRCRTHYLRSPAYPHHEGSPRATPERESGPICPPRGHCGSPSFPTFVGSWWGLNAGAWHPLPQQSSCFQPPPTFTQGASTRTGRGGSVPLSARAERQIRMSVRRRSRMPAGLIGLWRNTAIGCRP